MTVKRIVNRNIPIPKLTGLRSVGTVVVKSEIIAIVIAAIFRSRRDHDKSSIPLPTDAQQSVSFGVSS
jgi:hypothetical protein